MRCLNIESVLDTFALSSSSWRYIHHGKKRLGLPEVGTEMSESVVFTDWIAEGKSVRENVEFREEDIEGTLVGDLEGLCDCVTVGIVVAKAFSTHVAWLRQSLEPIDISQISSYAIVASSSKVVAVILRFDPSYISNVTFFEEDDITST